MTEEERKQYDKERKHKWYEKKKEKIKTEKLKRYRSYDITFCSKKDCKNKECFRNQNNYDFSNLENHPISISHFKECKDWKEEFTNNIEYLNKKRLEVLEEIKPICEVFNIEYDYVIGKYGDFSETLILNGQDIGCSMNSISAVKEEVIGYIFVNYYGRWWYHKPHTLKAIKSYWKE